MISSNESLTSPNAWSHPLSEPPETGQRTRRFANSSASRHALTGLRPSGVLLITFAYPNVIPLGPSAKWKPPAKSYRSKFKAGNAPLGCTPERGYLVASRRGRSWHHSIRWSWCAVDFWNYSGSTIGRKFTRRPRCARTGTTCRHLSSENSWSLGLTYPL